MTKCETELANLRIANLSSATRELLRELDYAITQSNYRTVKQAASELSGIYLEIQLVAEVMQENTNPKEKHV